MPPHKKAMAKKRPAAAASSKAKKSKPIIEEEEESSVTEEEEAEVEVEIASEEEIANEEEIEEDKGTAMQQLLAVEDKDAVIQRLLDELAKEKAKNEELAAAAAAASNKQGRASSGLSARDVLGIFTMLHMVISKQMASAPGTTTDSVIYIKDDGTTTDKSSADKDAKGKSVADTWWKPYKVDGASSDYEAFMRKTIAAIGGKRATVTLKDKNGKDVRDKDGKKVKVTVYRGKEGKDTVRFLEGADRSVPIYYKQRQRRVLGSNSFLRTRVEAMNSTLMFLLKNKRRKFLPHINMLEFHHAFGFHYEQLEDYVTYKFKKVVEDHQVRGDATEQQVMDAKKRFDAFKFDLMNKDYYYESKKRTSKGAAAASAVQTDAEEESD